MLLFGAVACDGELAGGQAPASGKRTKPAAAASLTPLETPAQVRTSVVASGSASGREPSPPLPLDPARAVRPRTAEPSEEPSTPFRVTIAALPPAGPPSLSEVNVDALAAARSRLSPVWNLWLDREHLRLEIAHDGGPLARQAQIRSRLDRLGHVLVWPAGRRYRVLVPGALRSVFDEARADVAPMVQVDWLRGEARWQGRTAFGSFDFRLATAENLPAAALWCRFVLELAGIDGQDACSSAPMIREATLSWEGGGGVRLDVVERFSDEEDASNPALTLAPRGAAYVRQGLPTASGPWLENSERATWRTKVIDTPRPLGGPDQGFLLRNDADRRLWFVVDGIASTSVAPGTERLLGGVKPGRYSVRWRSFLGRVSTEVVEITSPARYPYPLPPPPTEADAPAADDG